MALTRGIVARSGEGLGNFWQDLVRSLYYILLPLSIVVGLILVSQGVLQTLGSAVTATTLEGANQTLALGPVASQIAIKQLGTNGGGFFNVNSAMPFENPTQLSNFVEALSIILIPAALTYTYGRMVGRQRQGWAIFASMLIVWVAFIAVIYPAEQHGTPAEHKGGSPTTAIDGSTGGNLEGKEAAERDRPVGAVGDDNDGDLERLGQLRTRVLHRTRRRGADVGPWHQRGDLRRGRHRPLLDAALRHPGRLHRRPDGRPNARVPGQEDPGARDQAGLAGRALHAACRPGHGGAAIGTKWGQPSIFASGPQGFSETLYAYLSQANNNGSAFAGYTGFVQPNAPGNVGAYGITFADLLGGLTMLTARFIPILFVLAVAGSLAEKKVAPAGAGTMRTDNRTFVVLLIGVIVLVGALTFFPALLLGPDRPEPDHEAVLRCDATCSPR